MGHGGSGSGPSPGSAVVASRDWPTAGGCPRPVNYGGSTALGPRGPELPGLESPLDYTQCASSYGTGARARTRRPMGVHPLLLLPASQQLGT